jgi:hypothetical protein
MPLGVRAGRWQFGSGCGPLLPRAGLTPTTTKRSLDPVLCEGTNGRCSRYNCRRPLGRWFSVSATASALFEQAVPPEAVEKLAADAAAGLAAVTGACVVTG